MKALIVCMATRGSICVETHNALTFNLDGLANIRVTVARKAVDDARNEIVAHVRAILHEDPLKIGSANYYCLSVDDDAWWPAGTITALLEAYSAHPQYDVLSACFSARAENSAAIGGWITDEAAPNASTRATEYVDAGAIYGSDYVGMHFTLYKAELLERLPDAPFTVRSEERSAGAEDVEFSRRVIEIGGRLAVATGVLVAHVDASTGVAYCPSMAAGRIVDNRFFQVSPQPTGCAEPAPRSYGARVDAVLRRTISAV
jgi:hypothetical protein